MLDTIEIQTKIKEKLQRVTEDFLKETLEEESDEIAFHYDINLGINLKISCCNYSRVVVSFNGEILNPDRNTD